MTLTTAALSTGASASAQQRVLGLDVSCWQGNISQTTWNNIRSNENRQFVFIRASRGGTTGEDHRSCGFPSGDNTYTNLSQRYDDLYFVQNINRATTAGMFAGSYHFGRPDITATTGNSGGIANNGTDEAEHFIQMAGPWMRPGYLPPVCDLEAGSGSTTLAQFCVDFSSRIYARMGIRPAIYINGNYSSMLNGASTSLKNQLAQPPASSPSVVSPGYPYLWNARWGCQTCTNFDINTVPAQTGNPKDYPITLSSFYGPWDAYGPHPWVFWQYGSVGRLPSFNSGNANLDFDVAHGDIEYVKNQLIPAVWMNDSSGDWSTLTNWNSGQTPIQPPVMPGQVPPVATGPLPTPRLPGASGSGVPSGQHDTVILERPNTNITVTISTGTHNVRKLYVREGLNITGGSLAINYNPTYRLDDSTNVLHAGPFSAQFSGSVTLSGGSILTVHTLQVDATQTFTLAGGTVAFNTVNLMPHNTTPARLLVTGDVNINSLANATATIARGAGSGNSGLVDLGGDTRAFTVTNSSADVDLAINVPIINGALSKLGLGTMSLSNVNTYSGGTTVSAGRLLVNNTTGSGTGSGGITVNGGRLGGTGTIAGVVTVNSAGTVAPGTASSIGRLTLNSVPTFGGTNFMRINRNGGFPLADRIALSSGTLNYGGTLVVSNAGAALTGGEVFTNFSAPAFSGTFAATILPMLDAGLNWYTGMLTTNGTIKVNRGPTANPAIFTNVPPMVLQIPLASLTANATDPDGDTITVAGINLTTTNGITLMTDDTFIFYSNYVSVIDRFDYVIHDGHGGSATGAVHITSSPTGRFTALPSWNGETVTLHFAGRPGWTYYLDRSTNLPVWMMIGTNVAPASGVFDYTDDFHDLSQPPSEAFYRLRWVP